MSVNQTQLETSTPTYKARVIRSAFRQRLRRLWRMVGIYLALLLVLFTIGRHSFTQSELTDRTLTQIVAGWDFNLFKWEFDALTEKAATQFRQPVAHLSQDESLQLVREYMDRAQQMAQLEGQLNQILSTSNEEFPDSPQPIDELQTELELLRATQQEQRPGVEQIIQQQVGEELLAEGFAFADRPFPPVLFSFTEPPKKMVVSPRDRIETIYARMLDAEIGLEQIEQSEESIYYEQDLSAYITNIGGLGVFPTMVIDRASLGWVLSTVAHEWVHNYLTLFPLGMNYVTSPELTTINETVAEIVGDEIGERVLRGLYPDLAPPLEPPVEERGESQADVATHEMKNSEPPPFDFRAEMRETRLEVDRLLAEGKVEEAEAYMEARRLVFNENGYHIRVLNQAYFAFHGSYGTSPASSSPIGPKLQQLRQMVPNLNTFLRTVRWFTSVEDVDRALADWGDE